MASLTLLNEALAQAWVISGNPVKQGRRKGQRLGTLALSFFLFTVSLAAPAAAQEAGMLEGSVADERGALIVGSSLSLDGGRGRKYSTLSDKQGLYRFVGVSPGSYTLTASAVGFIEFTKLVELAPSRLTTLDVTLRISLREQVEVQSSRHDLDVVMVAGQKLGALPQDPRQLRRQLRRLAGAIGGPENLAIYVDGFREEGRLPPKEAIESIRIKSDQFAAEFAEPDRARVEIITKPATDTLHGEINFNFNDESLNARNPFALVRAPLRLR